MIDETKQVPCIFTSFEKIRNSLLGQKDVLEEIYQENKREGYQRVRKVNVARFILLSVQIFAQQL